MNYSMKMLKILIDLGIQAESTPQLFCLIEDMEKEIAELSHDRKIQNECIADQHDEIRKLETQVSYYRLPV